MSRPSLGSLVTMLNPPVQDNAGKTTLLYRLKVTTTADPSSTRSPTDLLEKVGEVVTTIPTIGFNVESVTYKNLNFNVWVCTVHFSQTIARIEN